jgi:outer membrane translocation and assembly module TamA
MHLLIEVKGKDADFLKRNLTQLSSVIDSGKIQKVLSGVILRCNELSFLQAEFGNVSYKNDTCTTILLPGKSYKWISLKRGNVPLDILSAAGLREEQFYNKMFDPLQFSKRAELILTILENNGYPFATIKLDSILVDSDRISASINLSKGAIILFDSIDLRGNAQIKKWYLEKYLGIKKGNPYNETILKNADSRLSQLPFLKSTRTTAIYFYGDKARPVLFLDNRKASSIDGVVGFAPNSQLNNQLVVTGEANLKLQNILGSGKELDLNYRSFGISSQDLKFKFQWPYIFHTNLAFDYQLSLLKMDSLFLDVTNEFSLQYKFIGTDNFRVFYSIQTTSLISVDTNTIKQSRALPNNSDIKFGQYGIGFRKSAYDYYLNPRKGYSIEVTAGVGTKQIIQNSTIKSLVLYDNNNKAYSIYDSLKLEYVQYKITFNADYFLPIASRITFRNQVSGAHIEAQNIFYNELYRIGGVKTLKGFDEQSIFASSYVIINSELRYLLQQNSNFMLFWNGAWYRNFLLSDKPYGFGAGLNFETGAGIFSVFYAVGSQFNNQIEFNQAKIHFGFVNYF